MNNSAADGDFPSLRATANAIDKASVWFSLITGIPGNIFIFLTVRSFPPSVARFHFQLLSVMDLVALCLQLSIRGIDWYDLAIINSRHVSVVWKIYFNLAYFLSVYANWVLVYIAMERLIALRYPSQAHVYLTVSRAKVNAVITAVLMLSFSIIVTVKMNYFGIAWLVIFTTFYTAFPLLIVFIIIWLLLGTMGEHMRQRKILEKEREKHGHHHNHYHQHHNQQHHKDGYKTPGSGITPTSTRAITPVGNLTPKHGHTPTMTKSASSVSKHSSSSVLVKHDQHVPGTTTSVSRQTLALSFTAKPSKSAHTTPEPQHESLEALTRNATEKKALDTCYTIMMLTLSVTFVLLTVPYTAIEYVYVTSERVITDMFDEKQATMYLLIVIALAFMFIEHSCNFCIFFLFSDKFRHQFIQVITRKSTVPTIEEPDQAKSFV